MSREMKPASGAVAEKPDRAKLAETGKRIDDIRKGYEQALADAGNDYERGCIVACGLIDLRQAVKEYLPVLKQLQGSKLGFLTDRDPGNWKNEPPYPDQVLIDCAIEAVMRGARWTGNEMNILAGGVYLTKEYWWRKVTEIEGLADLDLVPGIPEVNGPKALVGFVATWKLDGRPQSITRRFSVSVRKGQGDDATIGKAEARMLKAIYRKLTGTDVSDAAGDEPAAPEKPAPAALADRRTPFHLHAAELEEAETLPQLAEAWAAVHADRRLSDDERARLTALRDGRGAAMKAFDHDEPTPEDMAGWDGDGAGEPARSPAGGRA